MAGVDRERIVAERGQIRAEYLREQRPSSSGRGVHHIALWCADGERTIKFYQELLEFPLAEILESRDYQGCSQFFFDIGHGNLLAFADLPGADPGGYPEIPGGLQHIAISVEPGRWQRLRDKLDAVGVPYEVASEVSLRFRDPDGARLELRADPLGEMHGVKIL